MSLVADMAQLDATQPPKQRRRRADCGPIYTAIVEQLQSGPKSAFEIASATGLEYRQVMRVTSAMHYYGRVVRVGVTRNEHTQGRLPSVWALNDARGG